LAAPIKASGGILLWPSADGLKVLVVHRPRYDDWTFPKGKDEPGETAEQAALREVAEETGQIPRLLGLMGSTEYSNRAGGTKRVAWYAMRTVQPQEFLPNPEVDQIRWATPAEARDLLTYDEDRHLLATIDIAALARTGTLYLVRHGAAGERQEWDGEDSLRPLSKKGERQAAGLVDLLGGREIEVILTSPYVRCRQTVEPLAAATGLKIVEHPALAEAETGKSSRDLARDMAGTNAVLCSHGDVIPALLDWMARRGMPLQPPFDCQKGSTWEVEVRAGEFRHARYLPPVAR
jgi:8-oxo-dGTP diphosphatase